MATANFFHVSEKDRKELLAYYADKFDKKGDKYKNAIRSLTAALVGRPEDIRSPEQFLYDLQSMWIKEDAALAGLNLLLPSRIKGALCGGDSDREVMGHGVESSPDFEFTSLESSKVAALQFKVTRNVPTWFRIKASDYRHILIFQDTEKQLYYLNKDRILDCDQAYDIRDNWPKGAFFQEEWNQEVYYVPGEIIQKNHISLSGFIKLLVNCIEK
jgi:hypothetical protein